MSSIDLPIFSTLLLAFGITKLFQKIPLVPKREPIIKSEKPILIIYPFKTLLKYNFSLLRFNYVFYRRKFTEEFLFNLGCIYDIFFITENDLINKKIYDYIDPLGISTYRLLTHDKKKEIEKIKENNQVVILDSTDSLEDNYLNIKSLNSASSPYELLDVVNFLSTLNLLNIKNVTRVLGTYRNKDFYLSFDKVQKSLFKMRNMLNLFSGDKYEKIKNQIYKEKIDNYKMNKEELMRYRNL